MVVDAAGNVYVTGASWGGGDSDSTGWDYATVKYDSEGNQLWVQRYNGWDISAPAMYKYDYPYAIAVDTSGNVYVTGSSINSVASYDYTTVKYDSAGNEEWVQRYDGPGNGADVAYAIAVDASGDVYVTGTSDGVSGSANNYDYATVKYDSAGNEKWVERYDGPGDVGDFAVAIAVNDTSGDVYVTGQRWETIETVIHRSYFTVKYTQVPPEDCTNGIDDDGDGDIDCWDADCPDDAPTTYYGDADGDGYGVSTSQTQSCTEPTVGSYATVSGDCDDTDASVNPGATEVTYNGKDDDCDPATPDDDLDGDGFGIASDCDDNDPGINPAVTEVCDGVDNNCDGQIDEGVKNTYYLDADGDGYGDPDVTTLACSAPDGYVSDNTDCDDTDAAINPGAEEISDDGIDNDCDGLVDCDDPDCPKLSIDVKDAKVDFDRPGQARDKVKFDACFSYVCMPKASDLITVVLDGVTLLSVPFSSFEEEDDGEYEYKAKDLHVEIDCTEGKFEFKRYRMDLSGLDNSDGVDVDISFGIATSTDHFVMKEKGNRRGRDDDDDDDDNKKKKWSYKEKGHCDGDDNDDDDD